MREASKAAPVRANKAGRTERGFAGCILKGYEMAH
jgi:hypothetical protein